MIIIKPTEKETMMGNIAQLIIVLMLLTVLITVVTSLILMAKKEKEEEKNKIYETVEMEVVLVDIKSKNNRTVYFKHNENEFYKVQEVLVQHQAIPVRNIGDKQEVTYDVQEDRYFIAYDHYRHPKNDLTYLKDGIPEEIINKVKEKSE